MLQEEKGEECCERGTVEKVVRVCPTLITSHGLDCTSPLSGRGRVSGRRMPTMTTTTMMTASAEIVRIDRPEFVQYIIQLH